MGHVRRPQSRDDFQIAIICALPIERNAVEALLDEEYEMDGFSYGKAAWDPNAYTTGRLGNQSVVLAYPPYTGTIGAAVVAANLRSSFERIKVGFVVGVCGSVPTTTGGEEILLGDVIISTSVIQVDFGRQYPNKFVRKNGVEDTLGRANLEIRAFVAKVSGHLAQERLKDKTSSFSTQICSKGRLSVSAYPGPENDVLYPADHRHKHHMQGCNICDQCKHNDDDVCGSALKSYCEDLGCKGISPQNRKRIQRAMGIAQDGRQLTITEIQEAQRPSIHFGRMACGNQVIKSGQFRDRVATEEGVIGFEMESAGTWDCIPTVVVKSVCDYADSHKNKWWQGYAAAAAAACTKAILEEWRGVDGLVRSQAELNHSDPSTEREPTDDCIEEEKSPPKIEKKDIPAIISLIAGGDARSVVFLLDHVDITAVHTVFDPLGDAFQPLHVAAFKGCAEIVRILLERGAVPTILSGQGCTALHYAVNEGHVAVVNELLRRDDNGQLMYPLGDYINLSTSLNKAPPLVYAASRGFTEIVIALLGGGADPNVHGINRANSLHVAGGLRFDGIVEALLRAGADPNNSNIEGILPIHVVNSARAAEMLIEAGSDLSATIRSRNPYNFAVGATPLRVCVDSGNLAVVEVLARHCNLEQLHMKAADGNSVLQAALNPFKPSIWRVLCERSGRIAQSHPRTRQEVQTLKGHSMISSEAIDDSWTTRRVTSGMKALLKEWVPRDNQGGPDFQSPGRQSINAGNSTLRRLKQAIEDPSASPQSNKQESTSAIMPEKPAKDETSVITKTKNGNIPLHFMPSALEIASACEIALNGNGKERALRRLMQTTKDPSASPQSNKQESTSAIISKKPSVDGTRVITKRRVQLEFILSNVSRVAVWVLIIVVSPIPYYYNDSGRADQAKWFYDRNMISSAWNRMGSRL